MMARRATAALSQISGKIEVDGLTKPVEVIRDRWGVPHIYAETTEDLFFAQGFVAAQDRLWQMEIWRRNGEGRLAARAQMLARAARMSACAPNGHRPWW